jgi:hypothetical protein
MYYKDMSISQMRHCSIDLTVFMYVCMHDVCINLYTVNGILVSVQGFD